MKKIIFPFFNKEQHGFLFNKWMFRMVVVMYIIAIPVAGILFFMDYIGSFTSCYDFVIKTYEYGSQTYNNEFANCRTGVYNNIAPAIGLSILFALVFNYLVQVIFFKVIINYIVCGNRK